VLLKGLTWEFVETSGCVVFLTDSEADYVLYNVHTSEKKFFNAISKRYTQLVT
jgi:hypothetical protein